MPGRHERNLKRGRAELNEDSHSDDPNKSKQS